MIKALMIESENVTRFHEVGKQSLGAGDVRVGVRHIGLCGSDLNTFKGLNPLVQLPRIPGMRSAAKCLKSDLVSAASFVLAPGSSSCRIPTAEHARLAARAG